MQIVEMVETEDLDGKAGGMEDKNKGTPFWVLEGKWYDKCEKLEEQ